MLELAVFFIVFCVRILCCMMRGSKPKDPVYVWSEGRIEINDDSVRIDGYVDFNGFDERGDSNSV